MKYKSTKFPGMLRLFFLLGCLTSALPDVQWRSMEETRSECWFTFPWEMMSKRLNWTPLKENSSSSFYQKGLVVRRLADVA